MRQTWSLPFAVCSLSRAPTCTIPYHTIPYRTIPFYSIPYHSIPYHTIPYHTMPYHTIPYHTIPYQHRVTQTLRHPKRGRHRHNSRVHEGGPTGRAWCQVSSIQLAFEPGVHSQLGNFLLDTRVGRLLDWRDALRRKAWREYLCVRVFGWVGWGVGVCVCVGMCGWLAGWRGVCVCECVEGVPWRS